MRTKQVECILFRKRGGVEEFLLLKRIAEKGGFWQPPCGGVEKEDDSLLSACYREIQEETGITKHQIIRVFEDVHVFTMHNDYLTGEKSSPLTEYVFGFEVDPLVDVRLDVNVCVEHEEFRWVPFDEALEMLKWGDNKDAFKNLRKMLMGKGS